MHYLVYFDVETAERAGASGTVQIAAVVDEEGQDHTEGLDVGIHFFSEGEILTYLREQFEEDDTFNLVDLPPLSGDEPQDRD